MRIAQQENSVEKRGWVAWFTRETNKTSRQEACTTYVGHRRPSLLPKEGRHWGLPGRILEAQAKLVSLVGLCGPDGNPARGWEKEWHGETKLQWARPIALFSTGLLYPKLHIEDNRGCEIMQSQQSLILIETRVSFLQTYHIQMV